MKHSRISSTDPRLTAYALGELDAAEIASFEAALRNDPEALEAVAEIRGLTAELAAALENEPVMLSSPRSALASTPAPAPAHATFTDAPAEPASARNEGRLLHFPGGWMTAATAAGFAALVGIHSVMQHGSPRTGTAGVTAPAATAVSNTSVEPASTRLDPAALVDADRRRDKLPDGFSDIDPSIFRDRGLKLGKSVASNDDAPAPLDAVPIPELGDASSGVRAAPVLNLNLSLPVVAISPRIAVPLVDTGTDFSVASKDFNFSATVASFGNLLSETPHQSGMTYDQLLSWAHENETKADKPARRDELIDPLKKPKSAAVE